MIHTSETYEQNCQVSPGCRCALLLSYMIYTRTYLYIPGTWYEVRVPISSELPGITPPHTYKVPRCEYLVRDLFFLARNKTTMCCFAQGAAGSSTPIRNPDLSAGMSRHARSTLTLHDRYQGGGATETESIIKIVRVPALHVPVLSASRTRWTGGRDAVVSAREYPLDFYWNVILSPFSFQVHLWSGGTQSF